MINELLGVGATAAKSAAEISQALKISKREVTKQIHRERVGGFLICSNGSGYYLPSDINEIRATALHLYKRAKQVQKAADSMTDAISWWGKGAKE